MATQTRKTSRTSTRAKTLEARAKELGPAGKALWAELGKSLTLDGGPGLLALETCRSADRLEELEHALAGKAGRLVGAVLDEVEETNAGAEIHVHLEVDRVMAEARQQQNTLRSNLQALGLVTPKAQSSGGGILDQLAARRAAREQDRGSATSRLQPPS